MRNLIALLYFLTLLLYVHSTTRGKTYDDLADMIKKVNQKIEDNSQKPTPEPLDTLEPLPTKPQTQTSPTFSATKPSPS